jgi:predicted DNA-binding WGR domain protein
MATDTKEKPPIALATPDELQRYQLTSLDGNSNKFWNAYVYGKGEYDLKFMVHHGRVGDRGVVHDYGTVDRRKIEGLIREKLRKGYRKVELVAVPKDGTKPAGADLSTPEGRLVALIFKEAGEAISQYLSTTVDHLSQSQIADGRRVLSSIRQANNLGLSGYDDRPRLVEIYYTTIPTKLPRRIDRDELVKEFLTDANLAEQEERLKQLEAAIDTLAATSKGESQITALGAKLTRLGITSPDYKGIKSYVESTAIHGYKVRVEIPGERQAYLKDPCYGKGAQLLFHGTRNSNVRHILRSGLVVMRNAASGRMLGDGIYFASKSSKSTNYCSSSSGNPQMLLLSEVSLGRMYEAPDSRHYTEPPKGYDSVWGVKGKTRIYGSSTLQNDEYVVYRPSQSTIRYLVTFTRGY